MKTKSVCTLFRSLFVILSLGIWTNQAMAQGKTENVILITFDGFRWEEMFGGAVDSLMNDPVFTSDTGYILKEFNANSANERRFKILPWFWNTFGTKGQIYGNRWYGNMVNCTNIHWFSYPGYNEILTGFSDPWVNSNDKKYNKNYTVLEWLNQKPEFKGKVAAFGSWDVFPYIINDQRSGIPVNAGYMKATGDDLTEKEKFLNEIQFQFLSPWSGVRFDAFTHHYAMEYMKKHHPRIVYISYGETDDYAHNGKYDRYLLSARQTDQFLKEIWDFVQSDPMYKDKTTMIITTDHGRGASPKEEWKSHGKIYKGSPAIWIAAMGPDIAPIGEVKTQSQLFQNQVAASLAALLGHTYTNVEEVGAVIPTLRK